MIIAVEHNVVIITLDAPTVGNAFSVKDAEALLKALKKYEKDNNVHGLLFTAKGRLFCSGGNLSDYGKMKSANQGKAVNRKITAALKALSSWPKPTICVVQGDCFGGGVELMSAFDKVIALPEVMIGLWQRRVALTFGWGGGARIEARVGAKRLKILALEARSFSAHEAFEFGLVDEVTMKSQAMENALAWIKQAARLPKAPIATIKSFDSKKELKSFEKLWWNGEHKSILAKHIKKS